MTKPVIKPDLCIIGAGSGGLSVAAGAAQLGLKTVLLEKGEMGGDCLNTGCVPSKALLAAAKRAHLYNNNDIKGVAAQGTVIDFSSIKDHVFDTIETIAPNDSAARFQSLGVQVIKQRGHFTAPDTVACDDFIIKARRFVIATGSYPFIPAIEGLEASKIHTNETIFNLRERPEHLLVIGAGPIGVEMAQAHKRLGCRVSVFDAGSMLPRDDEKNVAVLREALMHEGIDIHERVLIKKIQHGEKRTILTMEKNGQSLEVCGTHLFLATGRRPCLDGLGLEKAGIECNAHGILVNRHLKTSNGRVFAIGDVAGGPQFTHVAGYHAGIVIRQVCFGMFWAKTDYTALPWVTFTDPEIAQTGMSGHDARKKLGNAVRVCEWDFSENDRGIAQKTTTGRVRVITDAKGVILGASIVGPQAGEMITLWSFAIHTRQKIGTVAGMIVPYPTLFETSKRAAGAWFTPKLFGQGTKNIVKFLKHLA